MASLNKVFQIGNLTRDVEVRLTKNGESVANIGLAVSDNYTKDGQLMKNVEFFDVTAWGTEAVNAGKYLRKGSSVHVSGRLKTESWDDKTTGEKRSKIVIVADNIQYLDKAPKEGDAEKEPIRSGPAPTTGKAGGKSGRPTPPPPPGDDDDLDTPF